MLHGITGEVCARPRARVRGWLVTAVTLTATGGLYAEDVKFSQPPYGDEENVASNVDFGDFLPNVALADDFVTDERSITAVRWWGGELGGASVSFGPLFGSDPCGPDRVFGEGILVTVDPYTGVATPIMDPADGLWPLSVTEIEWSPDGDTLYAATAWSSIIWVIDPDTGAQVGAGINYYDDSLTWFGNLNGLEFYCPDPEDTGSCVLLGTFFRWDSDQQEIVSAILVKVDTTPGTPGIDVLTEIGPINPGDPPDPDLYGPVGGLAFDPDGRLYGIISGPGGGSGGDCSGDGGGGEADPPRLLELNLLTDPKTQELTGVEVAHIIPTDLPKRASSLESLPDGRLIAGTSDGCLYHIRIQEDEGGVPVFGLGTDIGPHVNTRKLSGLAMRPNSPSVEFDAPDLVGCVDRSQDQCGNETLDEGEDCDPPNGVNCDAECQFIPLPGNIDGWLVGFHEPLQEEVPEPPPTVALALYFCENDGAVVSVEPLEVSSCDGSDLNEYTTALADCCLVSTAADGRTGSVPVDDETHAFTPEECRYAISIQAVVGRQFIDDGQGECVPTPTANIAIDDFWGWYSSEDQRTRQVPVSGVLTVGGGGELQYGSWVDLVPGCGEGNMAFELLTTEVPPGGPAEVGFDPDTIPLPIAIPDCDGAYPDPVLHTRTISEPNCGPILDIEAYVRIEHDYVGDLVVTLTHNDIHAETTTITLMSRADGPEEDEDCGGVWVSASNSNDVDVTFDDLAANSIETGPFPLSGRYRPYRGATGNPDGLSEFIGMDRCGDWVLTAQDAWPGDDGTLEEWSLSFTNQGHLDDCNRNGIPDVCDISDGRSYDTGAAQNSIADNGVPDDCETAKCRYVYLELNELSATEFLDEPTAIGVRLTSLHRADPSCSSGGDPDFSYFDEVEGCAEPIDPETGAGGCIRWIGPPSVVPNRTDSVNPDPGSYFVASGLQCEPFVMDWSTVAQLQLYGVEILPSSEYEVQPGDAECMAAGTCPAPTLVLSTAVWGAVADPDPDIEHPLCRDVLDVARVVDKVKELREVAGKPRTQLRPNDVDPSENVTVLDVATAVDALKGKPYGFSPHTGPCTCPPVVECPDTDDCGRCSLPPPRGVCCLENGQCREWTEETCLAELNAEYRGDWTECHLEDCTPPQRALRIGNPRPAARGY